MKLSEVLKYVDSDHCAAASYAPGYTAYAEENEDGSVTIGFHRDEMPAHLSRTFDSIADAMCFLEEEAFDAEWDVEERE